MASAKQQAWNLQQSLLPGEFTPCRWELFLRELGLTDRQALAAVRKKQGIGALIRAWIEQFRLAAFIPEAILIAVGRSVHEDEVFRKAWTPWRK